MKIIAGLLKGMKILAPKDGEQTRPTSAKVREATIHRIFENIEGSVFIDFFSGTGAVGLEALSRGAAGAYFIEKDPGTLKFLKKNMDLAFERLSKQGFSPDPFKLFATEASKALKLFKGLPEDKKYVLWADPPYKDVFGWLKSFENADKSFTKSVDLFILEIDASYLNHPELCLDGWERVSEKVYSSTAVVMWRQEKSS